MTDLLLKGRIALVTGASRGIGAAVAEGLGRAGAHVVLLARTLGGLEAVDDKIRAAGGTATLMPMDLTDFTKIDALGAALNERFGKLDIFVGNAGMLGVLGPLAHMKAKDWQQIMDLNVTANFRLIRTLDPLLQKSDAGRAVFVTSGMGNEIIEAYWGAYGVSKAALSTLVKTYAAETEKTSIRVNIVRPGVVETALLAKAFPGGYPGATQKPEAVVPAFLDLCAPSCSRHGAVVDLYRE
ncbi:MAG: SDR family NAD(P)-dependent oxidoreductase [Alphaproteobacteria bacterium]|nr:SDR family NAD(P)-dependent oxidoreductase [Alphaproteobacteria bacterium]